MIAAQQPEGGQQAAANSHTAHPAGAPSALVIVGPSGVGKNTLIHRLREGNGSFGHSVSHTTRQPRLGEKVGFLDCDRGSPARAMRVSEEELSLPLPP